MCRYQVVAASLAVLSTCLFGCAKEEPKAPPAGNALAMAPGDGGTEKTALEILNQKCTVCHAAERFSAKAFTADEWNAVLDRMVGKGAKLSGGELDVLRHMRKNP